MKVERTNGIQDVERVSPSPDQQNAVKPPRADRVSVGEERKVEEVIRATRSKAGSMRAAKMQQIEAAVAKGSYHPDASRIADQILQAAEIDARMRALAGG